MRRTSLIRRALTGVMALLLWGVNAAGQEVKTAVIPRDSIRVGDVFHAALQVDLPASATLSLPDTLVLGEDLENAARKQIRVDSLANGFLRYLISYPITAWRPGQLPLPMITATFSTDGVQQTVDVQLPDVTVLSVLPVDTTEIEPKPPRDVWGSSRLWWPLILIALLVLVALAALYWWWRRRRRRAEVEPVAVPVPALRPRDWVARELERVERSGTIERGELRTYYIELSDVLRRFVTMVDADWSGDLTTSELDVGLTRAGAAGAPLIVLLRRADLVKFARHEADAQQARGDLTAARQWAQSFDKPLPLAEAA